MTDHEIVVIRNRELPPGLPTQGIVRNKSFETPDVIVTQSRIGASVVSEWHHHGERILFGYLTSGRLGFDFGPGGARSGHLDPGDYFQIPQGLIHRDVNPDAHSEAVVVAFPLSKGPTVVNVSGASDR